MVEATELPQLLEQERSLGSASGVPAGQNGGDPRGWAKEASKQLVPIAQSFSRPIWGKHPPMVGEGGCKWRLTEALALP